MKGTSPLDNDEIRLVFACFDGRFQARNRGLCFLVVIVGCLSGVARIQTQQTRGQWCL